MPGCSDMLGVVRPVRHRLAAAESDSSLMYALDVRGMPGWRPTTTNAQQ
jgi:hypothetical protein